MGRKLWIALGVSFVVVLLLGAGAAGWLLLHRAGQEREWLSAARDYASQEEWRSAQRNYTNYLSRNPEDLEVLKEYINVTLNITSNRRGELQRAIVAYNQLLRYDPENEAAEDELFDLYVQTESWGDLAFMAERRLREDPENEELQFYHARALDGMDRVESAISAYRELVEAGTQNAEVYGRLAARLHARGLTSQALEVLETGEEILGNDPEFQVQLGGFFADIGDARRAEEAFERALAHDAGIPSVLVAAARFYLGQQEAPTALALAEQAAAMAPEDGQVQLTLAQAHQRAGDLARATEILKDMEPLTRIDTPGAMLALAELQFSQEDLEAGWEAVDAYIEAFPGNTIVRSYFEGRESLIQGDADTAARQLANVHDQAPDLAPAHYFLAVAYIQSGQREMARATLESYLRRFPDEHHARMLLASEVHGEDSARELAALATSILDAGGGDAQTLITAALNLFDAAVRQGNEHEQSDTVKQLLNEAIARNPNSAAGYQALADVYIALEDSASARRILDEAMAADVSDEELMLTRVSVALAENEPEDARTFYLNALADGALSVDETIRWAEFMRNRGYPALAQELVTEAVEYFSGDEARQLEAVNLLFAGSDAPAEERLAKLGELEDGTISEALAERITAVKLQIARDKVREGGSENLARARDLLDDAGSAGARNPEAPLLRAEIHLRQEPPNLEAAENELRGLLEREPNNVRAMLGMSEIRLRQADLASADDYVERARRVAPNDYAVRLQQAEVNLRRQRFSEARRELSVLAEQNSADHRVRLRLAEAYAGEGNLAESRRIAEELGAETGGELAGELAALDIQMMLAEGTPEEALESLRVRYEEDPGDVSTMLTLANALARQGDTASAEQMLVEFAEDDTGADAWITLARFYLNLPDRARWRQASTALTRALIQDPENLTAITEMIEVHSRLGNHTEAAALCDRYLDLRPDTPHILHRKASSLAMRNPRSEEALETAERALALRDDPEYRALRGYLRLNQGDYEGASTDLAQAAEALQNTTAQLDAALAEAYLGIGDMEMAQRYHDAARSKSDAGQPVDQMRLERIYERLNREDG